MKTILFQGDSITDCGRDRNALTIESNRVQRLGTGYPFIISSRLSLDCPNQYRFENRGVSGDRIVDVYARIKADIINLRPDYMSLLIGINDVWHEYSRQNGVATPKFERIYRMLLDEIYEELPDVKILLYTPFVLRGSATVLEEDPKKWEFFRDGAAEKADAVCRIAKDYPVALSVTQPLFDAAEQAIPTGLLAFDGVHPSIAGNQILADEFLAWFASVK